WLAPLTLLLTSVLLAVTLLLTPFSTLTLLSLLVCAGSVFRLLPRLSLLDWPLLRWPLGRLPFWFPFLALLPEFDSLGFVPLLFASAWLARRRTMYSSANKAVASIFVCGPLSCSQYFT